MTFHKIPTLTEARNAYRAARASNIRADWDRLGKVLVTMLDAPAKAKRDLDPKPPKGLAALKRQTAYPYTTMEVTFANGRRWRAGVWRKVNCPPPVKRASRAAIASYAGNVSPTVPEVVSCEDVTGQPRTDEASYVWIPFRPSARTLHMLMLYEAGNLSFDEDGNGGRREGWHNGCNYASPAYDPYREQVRQEAA